MAKTLENNVPDTDNTTVEREGFRSTMYPGGFARAFGRYSSDPKDVDAIEHYAKYLAQTLMNYSIDPKLYGQSAEDWEIISDAKTIQVTLVHGYNFAVLVDNKPFIGMVEPFQNYSIYLRAASETSAEDQ